MADEAPRRFSVVTVTKPTLDPAGTFCIQKPRSPSHTRISLPSPYPTTFFDNLGKSMIIPVGCHTYTLHLGVCCRWAPRCVLLALLFSHEPGSNSLAPWLSAWPRHDQAISLSTRLSPSATGWFCVLISRRHQNLFRWYAVDR